MRFFMPDFYFDTFEGADREFFEKHGFRGILLDIDNTLEPYENAEPGEHVLAWFQMLEELGVKAAFVSNNGRERVERFNESLGFPIYPKAKKPLRKNLLRAMAQLGTTRENTVFMGDQIFTDVLAAHGVGIPAVLVPPIRDKRDPLTRFKRLLERPIMKKYKRLEENKK